jgi:DNA adenine methylase
LDSIYEAIMTTADTSRAAAISIAEVAGDLRARVLVEIRERAETGATCDEVEVYLGLKHQTASARIRELVLDNDIVDSARRRLTRSGHKAVVWVCPGLEELQPPLKWAGGKRWLLPRLRELYAPHRARRFVEPFVGGMSVALALRPADAWLNDANPHLIVFYARLRSGRPFTIEMIHDEVVYYAQRERFNFLIANSDWKFSDEAAELFYYLNKTCFNGLCRFNATGGFNVPFGKYKTITYRRDFAEYTSLLRAWTLSCGDFERLPVRDDDFVFGDPPYDTDFTAYSAGGFSWDDQVRCAYRFARHPGPVVMTNQATPRVIELHQSLGYVVETVEAPRRISANGDRATASEMIATRNL